MHTASGAALISGLSTGHTTSDIPLLTDQGPGQGDPAQPGQARNGSFDEVERLSLPFAPSTIRLSLNQGEPNCERIIGKATSAACGMLQYSSCSRTQFMVPPDSLRPLGARSSQLNAPINSSVPR